MVDFKQFVTNELMKNRKEKNVCSSQSPLPISSVHMYQGPQDIGGKCDIHDWNTIVVAYGEVMEVDPKSIARNVMIGEGNYTILVETVIDGGAMSRTVSSRDVNALIGRFDTQLVERTVINSVKLYPIKWTRILCFK